MNRRDLGTFELLVFLDRNIFESRVVPLADEMDHAGLNRCKNR